MIIGIMNSPINQIQRTADRKQILSADMGVNHGCFRFGMADEFLNVTHVHPLFQQVGGVGMPQRMGVHAPEDTRLFWHCALRPGCW